MNDLRSSRKPTVVPEKLSQPTITKTPPRSRPAAGELDGDTKELRRRKSRAKKGRRSTKQKSGTQKVAADATQEIEINLRDPAAFQPGGLESAASAPTHDGNDEIVDAPASRPARRREVSAESDDDSKFPWHHQFEDDEPQELQATSPLLSRAFRATTG